MSKTPYVAGEAESADGPLSKFPDWREGVAILMERAWLGVLIASLVFLAFFFQARRQTPCYRSTATLLVEAQIPKILNYQDVLAYNTRNLEYFNTHLNALHSRNMMAQALERSGLAQDPRFLPGKTADEKIEIAQGFVTLTAVEKSRMINIVVEHSDPQLAANLANALAQSYIQQDLDNRMGASMQAVDWLRERSEEYREKLERACSNSRNIASRPGRFPSRKTKHRHREAQGLERRVDVGADGSHPGRNHVEIRAGADRRADAVDPDRGGAERPGRPNGAPEAAGTAARGRRLAAALSRSASRPAAGG
jgi:capsular polysaccharide biosynthesis protein